MRRSGRAGTGEGEKVPKKGGEGGWPWDDEKRALDEGRRLYGTLHTQNETNMVTVGGLASSHQARVPHQLRL